MRALNNEEIIVELLYRKFRWYSNTSIMDLRKFLEPKVRQMRMAECQIAAWRKEAQTWLAGVSVEKLKEAIDEYYRIQLVK